MRRALHGLFFFELEKIGHVHIIYALQTCIFELKIHVSKNKANTNIPGYDDVFLIVNVNYVKARLSYVLV